MTPANRKLGSHARCSKAALTYVLRIIAADTVRLRGTRSQLIPQLAMSDFVVSFAGRRRRDAERRSKGRNERWRLQPTQASWPSPKVWLAQ
jgi:hypothetical protein